MLKDYNSFVGLFYTRAIAFVTVESTRSVSELVSGQCPKFPAHHLSFPWLFRLVLH
uniref:Uncharacterized protein n=1 Tax=Anguilla anguilla TaxID=7936 RepID=A0A0E9PWZ2_ANGAN